MLVGSIFGVNVGVNTDQDIMKSESSHGQKTSESEIEAALEPEEAVHEFEAPVSSTAVGAATEGDESRCLVPSATPSATVAEAPSNSTSELPIVSTVSVSEQLLHEGNTEPAAENASLHIQQSEDLGSPSNRANLSGDATGHDQQQQVAEQGSLPTNALPTSSDRDDRGISIATYAAAHADTYTHISPPYSTSQVPAARHAQIPMAPVPQPIQSQVLVIPMQSAPSSTVAPKKISDDSRYTVGSGVYVYRDYANVADTVAFVRKKTGGVTQPFPEKLIEMLAKEGEENPSVVGWLPHGRAFIVRKPKQFTQDIMPKYFRQSKLTSFQRQLNLYGFRRLTQGPDAGAYFHELFLKNRPELCSRMNRQKVKGTGHKQPTDANSEPNFYASK